MINGWKTMVCFDTYDIYCGSDSIEVDFPSIPHRGDTVWLTATLGKKLLDVILDNGHEMDYYPRAMFYGNWTEDMRGEFRSLPREEKEDFMHFCDYITVKDVFFDFNLKEVNIILTDK